MFNIQFSDTFIWQLETEQPWNIHFRISLAIFSILHTAYQNKIFSTHTKTFTYCGQVVKISELKNTF